MSESELMLFGREVEVMNQTGWSQLDPYQLEQLINLYYQNGLLDDGIGPLNENLYDLTESVIVEKWMYFTDEFRFKYRHSIYKE